MEYVLLGALGLGLLLFVLGWLMVVIAGFQRHPVTGLFALLPGINLVALPSLWHRVSGWVITGFVGVLLALVAWFAGANAQVSRHAQALGMDVAAPPVEAAVVPAPQSVTHTVELAAERQQAAPAPATQQLALAIPAAAPVPAQAEAVQPAPPPAPAPLPPTEDLPANALYHVVFKEIGVDKLSGTEGKYVRITQKDGRRREGKVLSASADSIELEERMDSGSVTLPVKLGDIRAASLMTSQSGE